MLDDLFRNQLTQLLEAACITIDGPSPWDVKVRDARMFRKTVLEGNLGFGESYMDGWWECDDLDELFYRILSSGIDRQLVTLTKAVESIQSTVRNLQKPARAFTVGKRHYDAGNDLFQAIESVVYNSFFTLINSADKARKYSIWRVWKRLTSESSQTKSAPYCANR